MKGLIAVFLLAITVEFLVREVWNVLTAYESLPE
jgi:hypothetical protein